MENNSLPGSLEMNSKPQAQRRRLLQTALAVTAGGGLQSLASADAFAASGESSTSHSSGMGSSMMRDAIKACLDCHSMCVQTAMNFCLERGGRHVEQGHFRLMLNCAELCQTSANFMLSGSPLHGRVCAVCAEACDACAKSCEQVGEMRECVEECRRCAKSCRTMT
jgi:hypothetical protein